MTSSLEKIQLETLDVLRQLFQGGERVALVDFPNYENSGDSLIFLGELNYLEKIGVHVDYISDLARYNPSDLRRRVPEGPILINGGGNFGDRWEVIQRARERVIQDFPDRHIIQLPQSIEFSEGSALDRARAVMDAHRSLTLLIRDHRGVARTQTLFPNARVIFCPDMAFGAGHIARPTSRRRDLVVLRRRDSESVQRDRKFLPPPSYASIDRDWGLTGYQKALYTLVHVPGALAKRAPASASWLYPILRRCYLAMARINVKNAVKILGSGRVVATDRLHAVVLAGLMGIPVVAMDNANGKISAIITDYLGNLPGIHFAESVEKAEYLVGHLLAEDVSASETFRAS